MILEITEEDVANVLFVIGCDNLTAERVYQMLDLNLVVKIATQNDQLCEQMKLAHIEIKRQITELAICL
ncbi:MAG TPA: hypothetical protein ENN12_01810 [Epsilonproteobacteria bacterium]|nr:hypothetical protein [Campylobacterota bacterium]